MPWIEDEPAAAARGGHFLDDAPTGGHFLDDLLTPDAKAQAEQAASLGSFPVLPPDYNSPFSQMVDRYRNQVMDAQAAREAYRPDVTDESMRSVLAGGEAPNPANWTRGGLLPQMGKKFAQAVFDTPLVPFHKLNFDSKTVADALNMLASGSPELSQDEANELQQAVINPGKMDKAVAGAQAGINETLESLTTPFAISTLGAGAVFRGLAGRILSAGFAADMARHTPAQLAEFRRAVQAGDPEAIARTGVGLGLGGAFLYGAAKHAATPDSPARGAAENLLKTAESGNVEQMQSAAEEFARKATEPPPADTSPDALAELQAALRGNQGKTSVFAQEPKAPPAELGRAGPPGQPSARPEVAALPTAEMRAALEFQKKTDEAVQRELANPAKNYEGMSRLELELLGGMGDAGALAEKQRRRKEGYAGRVRSNQGQPAETRPVGETGEEARRANLQQAPPERPEPVGARAPEARPAQTPPPEELTRPGGHLVEGDKFQVQDVNFVMDKLEFDPEADGRVLSVTLKDGPKFGTQTIEGGSQVIHIDEGTLRKNRAARKQAGEFAPQTERVQQVDQSGKIQAVGSRERKAILDDLKRGKIQPAVGEPADVIANWDMMNTLRVPPGWTVERSTPSKYGSAYWMLRDADGDPWKVSLRDHSPSPAREKEFGANDLYVMVKDANAPMAFAEGMTKLEQQLVEAHRRLPEIKRLESEDAKRQHDEAVASAARKASVEFLEQELASKEEALRNGVRIGNGKPITTENQRQAVVASIEHTRAKLEEARKSKPLGVLSSAQGVSVNQDLAAAKSRVAIRRSGEASGTTAESAETVKPSDITRPTDPVERALDKLKIDTDPSQLHAFGLIPEIWNGLIETVRLAYRGGKSIKEAIDHGLEWLRATHGEQKFDEPAVRAELEKQLERGPSLREEIGALESEMREHEARGEAIPQEKLDRYKELADELGEQIRMGREPLGKGGGRIDENLTAAERKMAKGAEGKPVPSFKGKEKLPSADLRDAIEGLEKWRHALASWWQGRDVRRTITYLRDAMENRASQFGAQAANHIRLVLNRQFNEAAVRNRNELREYALTFAVQADRNRGNLADWHELIGASEFAESTWGRRALKAIEYANEHWEKLAPVVEEYRTLSEAEREVELNAGVNVGEWKGGYVRQLIEGMDPESGGSDMGPQGAGRQFTRKRTLPTYAEHIARGDKPKTLNALDLLAGRVADGQKVINEASWLESLAGMTDPLTQEPVAQSVEWRPKRPIETRGSRPAGQQIGEDFASASVPEWEPHAPPGYHVVKMGPVTFALHNDYGGLFTALTAPSWARSSPLKQAVLQGVALAKHTTLLFDTFHLGRLAFWKTVITGKPTYGRGLTLADYTMADIAEMSRRGEVPADYAKELVRNKQIIDLGVREGFNVAGVWDNEHLSDVLRKLGNSGVPGLSPVAGKLSGFNRWLFGQYQRGAMSEAFLLEFNRISKARPEMSDAQVARMVAQDLNVRFGNLGRQGIFKSKTAQDLARLAFLAPQWNESLIRSEFGALKQLGQIPVDVAKGRRLMVGTLLKATGTMILGQFIANQIINQVTRHQWTWENEEEGFGPKISAWIPDQVGNGPGLFLNPLSIAAEYTHLVETKLHQTGGETDETIRRILNSRLTGVGRAVVTFITKKDELGRTLRGNEVWGAMGRALIPVPIGAGAYGAVGRQLVTGQPSEKYPGQFEKQALSSVGVKTDQAPSAEQRVRSLAKSFNNDKGIIPSAEFYASDFEDYTKALRIGNTNDAQSALEELLKKKTAKQVAEHYARWVKAPYTGQVRREREFFQSLTPEQRGQYTKSRDERRALAIKARAMLREVVTAGR